MINRFFDRIAPKTRQEARFRRDFVFFVFGALVILFLHRMVEEAVMEGYRQEVYSLEQSITRAKDTLNEVAQYH